MQCFQHGGVCCCRQHKVTITQCICVALVVGHLLKLLIVFAAIRNESLYESFVEDVCNLFVSSNNGTSCVSSPEWFVLLV